MRLTALVMAGGKGSRIRSNVEKPLQEIAGKPMILYVIDAIRGSRHIHDIIVAVSHRTPRTAQVLRSLGIRVFVSPGKGYVEDTQVAIKLLGLGKTLVVSADLPLITSRLVNEVVRRYQVSGKPALTVAYPESSRKRISTVDDERFEYGNVGLISAGLNVLDGKRIDEKELDEEVMILDRAEVALNVNTPEDLELARSMIYNSTRSERIVLE
jgi:adenosylcobinamide-phosphate guanylyltransferase